ncbi:MAG: aminotransferase class V-fold PLP-dependent enzyme [Bryobacteraceae bacterium]
MLQFDPGPRVDLWARLMETVERYLRSVDNQRVAPELDPAAIRASLAAYDFNQAQDAIAALDFASEGLKQWQVHTPHARYFGLFNPASTTMGIAADTLAAAFNCQLAAWSHSPFAVEVENHLVRAFGARFGYDANSVDGVFASGGAEANHTAAIAALTHAFPDFVELGVRALTGRPVMYASAECHHSFLKAARMCGLGQSALRAIPVDAKLRLDPRELSIAIAKDRQAGRHPFLVIATAGTTNAGAIDPLPEMAKIAARERLWFHVDAAWGGAAALSPSLRPLIAGMEAADSITFDAHKWLSVPMGAGLFLTRHRDILHRAFRTETAYMPKEGEGLDIVDPHLHSMQWSRRFIGLKVFLSLAEAGWDGYARAIDHMTAMGALLRRELGGRGWHVVNETPLPVVCFVDDGGADSREIARRVVASGKAWISTTVLASSRVALRACITNFRTAEADIHALVDLLDETRAAR